ncbi:hypothetical protein ABIC84_004199 [Mucilaginibacter sp. 3215]
MVQKYLSKSRARYYIGLNLQVEVTPVNFRDLVSDGPVIYVSLVPFVNACLCFDNMDTGDTSQVR